MNLGANFFAIQDLISLVNLLFYYCETCFHRSFFGTTICRDAMLHLLCICTDLVMYLPQSSFLLSPRGNTQQAKFGPGEGGEKKSEGQKSSSRSKKRGEWARKWAKNNCVIFDTPTPRPPWDVFKCLSSSIPT